MPGPYDPTLKAMVEASPEDWPVLAGLPRAPAEVIDADIATVSGAGDKVLRVRGTPPYLLHLEFQAGHDSARLPRRMHLYNTLLDDRHDLPVRSVAVLLRPDADSLALTGVYERGVPPEGPQVIFRYRMIRVWELSPEELLAGGLGALPLAPVCGVSEAGLPEVIRRMKERLDEETDAKRAKSLWGATYIILGLRFSRSVADQLLRGVVSMKESSTYQAILAEGRLEGRAEGEVREARNFLLRLGRKRFGPPDAAATSALEAIADVQRLEQLGERLDEVDSWQALLDLPAPRRRSRRRSPPS